MTWLVLDVASAPIPDAAEYLDGTVKAPSNYRDEAKIADYIATETAKRLEMAATDLDLARISGAAFWKQGAEKPEIGVAQWPETWEVSGLEWIANACKEADKIITYGGHFFDLPLLMRRARYLGVPFPWIDVSRFKSPHLDLLDLLSDRDPQRRRPLGFYVKRLRMGLTKPLTGAEESKVFDTQQWTELRASLEHDVTAIKRLAEWAGVIK